MEGECLKLLYRRGVSSITKTGEIADELGIPGSTATDLVGRMKARGLVAYKKYYGVSLTRKGHAMAEDLFRRHRLLELFFVRELALSKEKACSASSRLEEDLPKELANEICKKYGHPDMCPCGREIIPSNGCCPE